MAYSPTAAAAPLPDEWYLAPHLTTFAKLAQEASRRVGQAVGTCGYSDEAGAAALLGEEFVAIALRLTDGWAAICAVRDPAAQRALLLRLVEHLWAVRADGRTPLAPQDRARAAAAQELTRHHIGGRELLLTLAGTVANDADLVPIFEARNVWVDRGEAARIAKEMYAQWTSLRTMPKATFRRALARRLEQAGQSAGPSASAFSR